MLRTGIIVALAGLLVGGAVNSSSLNAAEILLPQLRTAYYATEDFEVALVGLEKGAVAEVQLAPKTEGRTAVSFKVAGDGSTVNTRIPAGTLAPGLYTFKIDGKDTNVNITISAGVVDSQLLVSQTDNLEKLRAEQANFNVGNAASFGAVLGPDGMPGKDVRARTFMLNTFDATTAADLPTLIYMYWTGYITHKPWGSRKTWEEASMQETMRLFSLHVAQRLRRYVGNINSIGTIDEPGLNWGRTPAGGWASGFANWDGQPWYEARGWKYTDDPASRDDADWMKYLTIRTAIIGDSQTQAKKDIQTVVPGMRFEADIYAGHVVMDGADFMNQQCNGDVPTTHVFLDWGIGRDGAATEMYIEKSNNPTANVAHAMNGQLFGDQVPQPQHGICYRVMMNAMLQAGLESNWWLNTGGMSEADLAAVNEPAKRYGPLLREMKSTAHDVAVVWSYTEVCMRQKDITAKEARKKTGEQIKMMIAALPENTAVKNSELEISAYTIQGNYRNQISHAHNSLMRAGYPAHVVHERILPATLKNYKTLVIVGQTFDLPADIRQAITKFAKGGGSVIVDKTTTVKFDGAIVTDANFKDPAFHWRPLFLEAEKKPSPFKTAKEGSYYQTNVFMDEPIIKAVAPMKAAMQKTKSKPAVVTDSADLIIERHVGGDGAVYMVLNARQELPQITDNQKYLIWNYAPCKATFTLGGVKKGSAVYAIEGGDWKKVSKLDDPTKPITADFEAGEMKLYLVAPRAPKGFGVSIKMAGGKLAATAQGDLEMSWPITIAVADPAGKEIYKVYRTLDAAGKHAESFPIGSNTPAGDYTVKVASPVGYPPAAVTMGPVKAEVEAPAPIAEAARVFEAGAIGKFLAAKPEITIAIGSPDQKAIADDLVLKLADRKIKAKVVNEKDIIVRARYPRVWNPFIDLYKNEGEQKQPSGKVDVTLNLETKAYGQEVATTADGKDLGNDWRKPNTLATVVGSGYIGYNEGDGEPCYEPGCVLYLNEKGEKAVLKGKMVEEKATPEARRKWSRPWVRLSSYNGGYNLPPQLPEAYSVPANLILLGDSTKGELVAALQGSELLLQVVDAKYPGPGKALVSFAWSPFALEKNVILIGATDDAGIKAGIEALLEIK